MNHDDLRTLLISAGLPTGGFTLRWLLGRRRAPVRSRPWLPGRIVRWCWQVITANARLGYTDQNLRDAKAALVAMTEQRDNALRENRRLSNLLESCRRSGNASPPGPIPAPGANPRLKRSPEIKKTFDE